MEASLQHRELPEYIPEEDHDRFDECISDAKKIYKLPMAPMMPCFTPEDSETEAESLHIHTSDDEDESNKNVQKRKSDSSSERQYCTGYHRIHRKNRHTNHINHKQRKHQPRISAQGYFSETQFALVHTPVSMKEVRKIPKSTRGS